MTGDKKSGTDQPTAPINDIPAPGTLAETNALLREIPITLAYIFGMHAALVNPSHEWRDRRAQASACTRKIIDFAGLALEDPLPDGDYVVWKGVIRPCRHHPSDDPAAPVLQEETNA